MYHQNDSVINKLHKEIFTLSDVLCKNNRLKDLNCIVTIIEEQHRQHILTSEDLIKLLFEPVESGARFTWCNCTEENFYLIKKLLQLIGSENLVKNLSSVSQAFPQLHEKSVVMEQLLNLIGRENLVKDLDKIPQDFFLINTLYKFIGPNDSVKMLKKIDQQSCNIFHHLSSWRFLDTLGFETLHNLLGKETFMEMLNAKNKAGKTPLHCIFQKTMYVNVIQGLNALITKEELVMLLEAKNKDNITPFEYLWCSSNWYNQKSALSTIQNVNLIQLFKNSNMQAQCLLNFVTSLNKNCWMINNKTPEGILFNQKLLKLLKAIIADKNLTENLRKDMNGWILLLQKLLGSDDKDDDCKKLDCSSTSDDDDDDDAPDGGSSGTKGTSSPKVITLHFNPDGTRNHEAETAANQGNNGRQQALSVNTVQLTQNLATENSWRNTEIISY